MQITKYLKGVAAVVLQPVVKSLYDSFPNYGTGVSMLMGNKFSLLGMNGMRAYNNKIFYAAANIFVRKIVEAPIIFSEKKGKFSDKYYSKNITNEQRAQMKATGLDEKTDHPLTKLFSSEPNTYQSGIEMMEDFWYNYGFGDGFLFFESLWELSRDVKPIRVHSLNRDRVRVVKGQNDFDQVDSFKYTCWNGTQIDIPKTHMLHLKHWNPNLSDLKGLGVDLISNMDISLNEANNTAQGAAFENGGRGTLFSSEVHVTSEGKRVGKMSTTEMEMLKETIQRDIAGARNNRRQKYTNGQVTVTPYGDTLAEMELVKSEENNWKSIFAIWGIPWSLAPITQAATDNNMAAGYKSLVTNLIISEIRKFDQKLNRIVTQKGWWPGLVACHDLTEYTELAPDLKLMKEIYGSPVASVDEVRRIFGFDDIGGEVGAARLVPSGMMKIEDIIEGMEEPIEDEEVL